MILFKSLNNLVYALASAMCLGVIGGFVMATWPALILGWGVVQVVRDTLNARKEQ